MDGDRASSDISRSTKLAKKKGSISKNTHARVRNAVKPDRTTSQPELAPAFSEERCNLPIKRKYKASQCRKSVSSDVDFGRRPSDRADSVVVGASDNKQRKKPSQCGLKEAKIPPQSRAIGHSRATNPQQKTFSQIRKSHGSPLVHPPHSKLAGRLRDEVRRHCGHSDDGGSDDGGFYFKEHNVHGEDRYEDDDPLFEPEDDFYLTVPMEEKQCLLALRAVREYIRKSLESKSPGTFTSGTALHLLRTSLHRLSVTRVTPSAICQTGLMHPSHGLPAILADASFPHDIELDAREMYKRWTEGNYDHVGNMQLRYSAISGDRHGANGVLHRMWYPSRQSLYMDGVHANKESTMHGEEGRGAFSLLLCEKNSCRFTDLGDVVRITGTLAPGAEFSKTTKRLIESFRMTPKMPVRMVRSSDLPKSNKYRPEMGLRYDGLYDVVAAEQEGMGWIVRLERQNWQTKIRWDGVEKRPTTEEMAAFRVYQ